MKKEFNKSLRPLLIAALAVVLIASSNSSQSARQAGPPQGAAGSEPVEPAVSYPTGAVAEFPGEFDSPEGSRPPVAYIKSEGGAGAGVWVLSTEVAEQRDVATPAEAGGTGEATAAQSAVPVVRKVVSFTVPQLPAGVYVAWYEVAERPGEQRGSMRLHISPQLRAADGLVRGNPGEGAEVRVGVDTTFVAVKGGREPEQKQFEVTLQSEDGAVVGLAPGQPATVSTGKDGYATWKVRLKKEGETVLRATAPGFEPSEISVVSGPPPSSPTAKAAKRELEEALEDAQDAGDELYSKSAKLDEMNASLAQSADKGMASKDLEKREAKKDKTEQEVMRARERSSQAWLRVSAAQERHRALSAPEALMSVRDVYPGDVLLILGDGFLSATIRAVDRAQTGRGEYSHAAVYLGEFGGRRMIAEMLDKGHTYHSLEDAMRDDKLVDVWRWRGGLNGFQRSAVVTTAKEVFRRKSYARAQIAVLSGAALNLPLTDLKLTAQLLSAGRKQLICSELVARAYHEAGLDPTAAEWWRNLADYVLGNDDRQHDYTTPNMLAGSGKFEFRGRLK
jgi:hypothetical protein